ncbi:putative disease resistance RPP13-like protein 1 isoform X2 [Mangifera indica]|uniref:putative disease resistance RPP13-like protein 1 isoform X2 n=1 Tax=Mangifera indica TaxID=29780 RepID=UPI001CF99CAA|nr:putative disease resistance RPP13-like protein 1 isoform X2 [Mangifera indica]
MEIVLEPLVSELLSGLFKILGSSEVRDFARQLVGRVDSEIKELESKLQMVEELLGNAEDRQLRDKRVKEWLDNLQHWAYDAEDLLDEFAYEALRRKRKAEHQASSSRGFSCLPASFCSPSFAVQMGSKIKEINSRLEELRQQRSHERQFQDISGMTPTNVAAPQNREETSSVRPEQGVYGRDKDKAELLKMVKNGANFQVIAVVGMGGIGKTTIAREVYNHKELEDFKFEKKAWVCVSTTTTFDVLNISKALLEQFSSSVSNNLDKVQRNLKDEVRGKKFLIVLDDIWMVEYDEWEKLMSPFTAGAPGSVMIVTTRDADVARKIRCSHTYRLRPLSNQACESLFKEHAFGTDAAAVPNQISDSIYKKVVERCCGLPLAARTLGSLLRFKPSDTWDNILESKIWSTPNESDHVLPALKLSYYYLPSNLKRCFGYCSIFPQDYEFEEKELALLWIAEGIVQPSEKQLDEASLHHLPCLESIKIDGCPKLSVREGVPTSLRQLLINECEDGKGMGMLASLKRLTIWNLPQLKSISDLTDLTSLKHLRIGELPQLELIPNLKYWSLTSLEILEIHGLPQLESIPDLSNLTSLQRLQIASLPQLESIQDLSNLTSLEDLQISKCPRIKSIPSLSGLTSLQELKIADLPQLESIQDLSNLTSLEDLQISKCPKLRSLQTLPSSLQSLQITDCPLLIKRWKSVTGKYSSKIAQIARVVMDGKFIYNSKEYEVDDESFFF